MKNKVKYNSPIPFLDIKFHIIPLSPLCLTVSLMLRYS